MYFDVSYFTYPTMNATLGRIQVKQLQTCPKGSDPEICREVVVVPTSNCTDESKAAKLEYWSPRLDWFTQEFADTY